MSSLASSEETVSVRLATGRCSTSSRSTATTIFPQTWTFSGKSRSPEGSQGWLAGRANSVPQDTILSLALQMHRRTRTGATPG